MASVSREKDQKNPLIDRRSLIVSIDFDTSLEKQNLYPVIILYYPFHKVVAIYAAYLTLSFLKKFLIFCLSFCREYKYDLTILLNSDFV